MRYDTVPYSLKKRERILAVWFEFWECVEFVAVNYLFYIKSTFKIAAEVALNALG